MPETAILVGTRMWERKLSSRDLFSMGRSGLIYERLFTYSVLPVSTTEDHATQIFMHWYVTDQVAEEDNVNDILNKLNGNDSNALLSLDKAHRLFQKGNTYNGCCCLMI